MRLTIAILFLTVGLALTFYTLVMVVGKVFS